MLTLALSSWSFHRQLPYYGRGNWSPPREGAEISILDFPGISATFGIADIEICQAHLASTDAGYLAEVRAAVERAGCRVINVPIDVGNLAEPDPEKREQEIASILPWIDAAHALGSPAVRVNTGRPGEMDEAQALQIVADGYRRLAAVCDQRDMYILLENHGGLSSSPAAIMQLLESVGAPNFRLCPDFGNFAPEVREEGLRAMLPHAFIVHAKIIDLDDAGHHGAFDLDRCVQIVAESGYSGALSIELEGTGDPYEGVRRARAYLTSHLQIAPIAQQV
ncbi:MAG TPA: sugar phosphate isomerase/epimerase family protein [Chloroflexota bacterium]